MNLYEKTVAQLERKEPVHMYVVTRTPITDTAKKFFGVYEFGKKDKQNPNYNALVDWMESNKRDNKTDFKYIFYYDDQGESEEERKAEAIRHSVDCLTRFKINRYGTNRIELNKDYTVTVKKVAI